MKKRLKPFAVYFDMGSGLIVVNVYATDKKAARERARKSFRVFRVSEAPAKTDFYNPVLIELADFRTN